MISKLAKAKESWFFKIISAAVAVSFVSLFGVTGYIHNASQNLSVVKVGNKKTTQSEFSYRLQKETNAIKNLTGDDFEISEEMRNSLIEGVLKQIINENVLDLTMDKYGIHFPKAFVQQAIFSQREFINPANGQFNVEMFKRYLSAAGVSEAEYVAMIKRMMGQRLLVSDLIKNFGVPSVLSKAVHKMDNQRKSFKYAVVSPQDIKVERKISDDEIKQYYADFGERFTVPEMRDAVVLFIPNEVILSRFAATDDMARDYFNEHKKELDVPEKREVLQMVFTDKESAQKAYDKVLAGQDFYKVAKELKAENAAEPTLGLVAYDELADELATAAFDMQAQETKLLEVADTWQVIRIKQVTAAKDAVFEEVRPQIVETLANEKLYDATRELRGKIDDEINGGKPLNEVAKSLGFDLAKVQNISEEKTVADAPEAVKNAVSTLDFNELVFSYGLNETTSAEEFDDGIIVAEVTKITDEHLPEIDDIKDEIISLWTVEEKNALAKETADNIIADTEDGSDLSGAAKARNIEVFRSEPINRNETFAGLTGYEINDLFVAENGVVKVFERPGNVFVIATPLETVNYENDLDKAALSDVENRIKASLFNDMSEAVLDGYAKDYKIEIDYKRAGFAE